MNTTVTNRLIQGYYYSTLPLRIWDRKTSERNGTAPISILFYHRVDDKFPNPWTIPCREFERQIDWLQDHCDVISLAEAQHRIVGGQNDRLSACITFDDGYADNCEFALPLLLERHLPFTYFVSLQYLVEQSPFPHDVERGVPLAPNTIDEIQYLADEGVEIGAHTRTHPDLGTIHNEQQLYDEVVVSSDELSQRIGHQISYFAFPFGQRENLNDTVFRLAKQAGFRGVCSAYGGYNYPTDDGFHLQRIHADPVFWRTKNWLSLDPRLHRVARYESCSSPANGSAEQADS